LDKKHVVYGEVINGKSVVREIENLKVQSGDKPWQDATVVGMFSLSTFMHSLIMDRLW
jgi:peptidyl-prolyl isomerase D